MIVWKNRNLVVIGSILLFVIIVAFGRRLSADRLNLPVDSFGKSSILMKKDLQIGTCAATIKGFKVEKNPDVFFLFRSKNENAQDLVVLISNLPGVRNSDSLRQSLSDSISIFVGENIGRVHASSGPLNGQDGVGFIFWQNKRVFVIEACFE